MSLIAKTVILLSMLKIVWATKVTVEITNTLEGKENLNIHCKSKDDDIGHHLLYYNQSFQWSFGTDFLGRTLFFCSFQWGNGDLLYLMYTLKTGIPIFVQTAIGTLQKVDHVATKPLNPYPFASAINGTNNVFFISVIYSAINKFIICILFYFLLRVTGTHL